MTVIPYRDTVARGLFSTRAPSRPNAIGISSVRLLSVEIEKGLLEIAEADMLDETPLLDVKPYVPQFDAYPESRAGWFDVSTSDRDHADTRFSK